MIKLTSAIQKISLISLPVLGIVASANLARGGSYEITQAPNCKNPGNTLEIKICVGRDYEEADKKLNQVYRQLKPKLDASQQKRLVTAQRAWIKFRDTSCTFEGAFAEGGTLQPVLETGCLADVTEQRVKDLERYLERFKN